MNVRTRTRIPVIGAVAVAVLSLSACGGMGGDTAAGSSEAPASSSSAAASDGGSSSSAPMADASANLVGPGCAEYAQQVPDGAGSVEGMAQDPVAVAASNNPMLTTLTKAVSGQLNPDVDLVDTLNSGEFTVFAPVDSAFAKVPEADLTALAGDKDALSTVLTYHVVPGRIDPADLPGTHTTVEGQDVTITGSGDDLTVNGASKVVCGGVQTQNATVYLVDTVLMPPAA